MSITIRTRTARTTTITTALGATGVLLAGLATPASASFNHTKILEMRGGYTVVTATSATSRSRCSTCGATCAATRPTSGCCTTAST